MKRLAINIATGGGKTFVFTKMIPKLIDIPLKKTSRPRGKGILILIHRKELADQAMRSIRSCKELQDVPVYLEMAKAEVDNTTLESHGLNQLFVVIASVPTLARSVDRLEKFNPDQFRAIIVDECHHAVSSSYLKVFKWFRCLRNEDTDSPFLLGFSATLQRHDKKPLKKVFDSIVYEKSMIDLVDEGYLVDCDWKMVEAGFNLSNVELGHDGDYKSDSLAKHVNTKLTNELALKTYKYFLSKRDLKSTLIFCCNVEHMQYLTQLFQANGITAEYVSGNTGMLDRINTIKRFKNGKINVLINCGVFTEGTDLPNIDSLMLLRPTKSKPLLTQMVGRGLRLSKGKDKCLVIDFVESGQTGLSLDNTLGGVTVQDPIGSLFGGYESHGQSIETPLTKQPDYIEFKSFEGFKDLVKNTGGGDPNKPKIQNAAFKQLCKSRDPWIQTRKDSWALKLSGDHYYQVAIDRGKQIAKLIYVSKIYKGGHAMSITGRPIRIPYNRQIIETNNFDEILPGMLNDMQKHSDRKDLYTAEMNRRFFYGKSMITFKQLSFLLGAIEGTINPTRQCHVNIGEFTKAVKEELQKMTKFQASNLIFAYTVSRKRAMEIWASRHVLNSKDKRLRLMQK